MKIDAHKYFLLSNTALFQKKVCARKILLGAI